jgi:hypothetical protein
MGNLRPQRARGEVPVNPPVKEATHATPGTSPAAAGSPPPATVAVDEADHGHDEPVAAEPELDAEGRPMPVLVPYARTGSDPEVVAAQSARVAPRPVRSPFWVAVRSHLWLGVIIVSLVGAAGTAYWVLRIHQRISEAAIERDVAGRESAQTVRCVEQQSNGAVWACGLVYRATSRCLIANVNPVGDWNTNEGVGLCDNQPRLAAILPDRITASAVEADMESQAVMANARCVKAPQAKVRWACLGPPSGGNPGECMLVRVAPWIGIASEPNDVCDHVPAFKKHQGKT